MDMNAFGNMDLASLFQLLASMDTNQLMALLSQMKIDPNDPNNRMRPDDPRIGLLNSLKSFMPPGNAYIIDDIIKMFTSNS